MYRIHWSQLRIGALVTAVTIVLAISIFFIDEVRDSVEDRYTLVFHTFTTQTLRPRAPVWFAGQPVGYIAGLAFEPHSRDTDERLRVELSIRTHVQPFITSGAAAQVITSGLLGEAVVNILPSDAGGAPLNPFTELPTAPELDPSHVTRRLEAVADSFPAVAERWQAVLREVQQGRGSLSSFVRRPEHILEVRRNLLRLSATFDTIRGAGRGLLDLFSDEAVRESLGQLQPRLRLLAEYWRGADGTLGQLARDSLIGERLERAQSATARISQRLDAGSGTAGRLMHDEILAQELARTREMIRGLKADLQRMKR